MMRRIRNKIEDIVGEYFPSLLLQRKEFKLCNIGRQVDGTFLDEDDVIKALKKERGHRGRYIICKHKITELETIAGWVYLSRYKIKNQRGRKEVWVCGYLVKRARKFIPKRYGTYIASATQEENSDQVVFANLRLFDIKDKYDYELKG